MTAPRSNAMSIAGRLARYTMKPTAAGQCWLWSGAKNAHGYGVLYALGRARLAHRLAWEQVHGAIPSGMSVCHHCDTRACVNPEHLFLGTNADNVADRHAKGRTRWATQRGQDHHQAKLTDEDVRAILASSERGVALAKRYSVSESSVHRVRAKKSWRHIHV